MVDMLHDDTVEPDCLARLQDFLGKFKRSFLRKFSAQV